MARSAEAARLASPFAGGVQPKPEVSYERELVPSGFLRAIRKSTPPSQPGKGRGEERRGHYVVRKSSPEGTGGLWPAVRRSVAFRGRVP
jgi:hypothetical protein